MRLEGFGRDDVVSILEEYFLIQDVLSELQKPDSNFTISENQTMNTFIKMEF